MIEPVPVIETRALGKTFLPASWPLSLADRRLAHPVRALHDVTLKVAQGEVFGLLGPNGAGKTTLLKILATVLLPSEGSARVHGADVVREGTAVRRAIGLATGEERGFYWHLSGRENLEFFGGLFGLAPRISRGRAQSALECVELLPFASEIVARYSTGMRHRLDIARALLHAPPVLLFDEPTRSLDPAAASQIRALVRRLAKDQGKTVLLVTHDLPEAATTCDRVAVLFRGTVRAVVSLPAVGEAGLAHYYHSVLEIHDVPLPIVGVS